MSEEKVIWRGFAAEASFRVLDYILTNQRIIIDSGRISPKRNQIELVNIKDIKISQSFGDTMLERGQIKIIGAYDTLELENVKEPYKVAEMIRNAMKNEKFEKVDYREIV